MYIKEELEAVKLYPKFRTFVYQIGSTKYKQTDFSKMLTTVSIKNFADRRFREIKDFFGEDAAIAAQRFILDRVNN